MIWKGKAPMTVGEVDQDTGKVLCKYTINPGEEIPLAAQKLLAEDQNPLLVDDKGKFDESLVSRAAKLCQERQ